MNDAVITIHLRNFTTAAAQHQRLDRDYRAAWRYKHKRAEIAPQRRQALLATQQAANRIRNTLPDTEPSHLTHLARNLLERWDNYRRNHAIMLAEYNHHNRHHNDTSRATFETALREAIETLNTITNTTENT